MLRAVFTISGTHALADVLWLWLLPPRVRICVRLPLNQPKRFEANTRIAPMTSKQTNGIATVLEVEIAIVPSVPSLLPNVPDDEATTGGGGGVGGGATARSHAPQPHRDAACSAGVGAPRFPSAGRRHKIVRGVA